jgi:hypothetical protein
MVNNLTSSAMGKFNEVPDIPGWNLDKTLTTQYLKTPFIYNKLPSTLNTKFQTEMVNLIKGLLSNDTHINYVEKIKTTEILYINELNEIINVIDNDWVRIYMRLFQMTINPIPKDEKARDAYTPYEKGDGFITIHEIIRDMAIRRIVIFYGDMYKSLEAILDEELTHLYMFSMNTFETNKAIMSDDIFNTEKEKLKIILKYFNITDPDFHFFNWRVLLEKKIECKVAGDKPCSAGGISFSLKFPISELCKLVVELHTNEGITMSRHMLKDHSDDFKRINGAIYIESIPVLPSKSSSMTNYFSMKKRGTVPEIYDDIITKCYYIKYQFSGNISAYLSYRHYGIRESYLYGRNRVIDSMEYENMFLIPSYLIIDRADEHRIAKIESDIKKDGYTIYMILGPTFEFHLGPTFEFHKGDHVILQDLPEERKELNDSTAVVISKADAEGNWKVEVSVSVRNSKRMETLHIKPANIRLQFKIPDF